MTKNIKLFSSLIILLLILIGLKNLSYGINDNRYVTVTLMWDPSPDTNVVGYKLYYGTRSRTYTVIRDAGANCYFQLTLERGVEYFFAATAYDSWALESDFSEELSYRPPHMKPGVPDSVRISLP